VQSQGEHERASYRYAFLFHPEQGMRLELLPPIGFYPLGVLSWSSSKALYLDHQKKEYFETEKTERLLHRVFGVALRPERFRSLLLGRAGVSPVLDAQFEMRLRKNPETGDCHYQSSDAVLFVELEDCRRPRKSWISDPFTERLVAEVSYVWSGDDELLSLRLQLLEPPTELFFTPTLLEEEANILPQQISVVRPPGYRAMGND
jgi:hypothetical protein